MNSKINSSVNIHKRVDTREEMGKEIALSPAGPGVGT
jgi:hypothetical protein